MLLSSKLAVGPVLRSSAAKSRAGPSRSSCEPPAPRRDPPSPSPSPSLPPSPPASLSLSLSLPPSCLPQIGCYPIT